MHWLIESDGFWSLFSEGRWRGFVEKNTFKVFSILASIYTVKPLWSSGKTLAANAGFESHRGQTLFLSFYSI